MSVNDFSSRPRVMNMKGVCVITMVDPGSYGVSALTLSVQAFSRINAGHYVSRHQNSGVTSAFKFREAGQANCSYIICLMGSHNESQVPVVFLVAMDHTAGSPTVSSEGILGNINGNEVRSVSGEEMSIFFKSGVSDVSDTQFSQVVDAPCNQTSTVLPTLGHTNELVEGSSSKAVSAGAVEHCGSSSSISVIQNAHSETRYIGCYNIIDVLVLNKGYSNLSTAWVDSELIKIMLNNNNKVGRRSVIGFSLVSMLDHIFSMEFSSGVANLYAISKLFLYWWVIIMGRCMGFLFETLSMHSSSGLALIISPTRKLSIQSYEEVRKFSYETGAKVVVAYGGSLIQQKPCDLERGVDILVITPEQLVDIIKRARVSLRLISYFALDEAGRMMDIWFETHIRPCIFWGLADCLFNSVYGLSLVMGDCAVPTFTSVTKFSPGVVDRHRGANASTSVMQNVPSKICYIVRYNILDVPVRVKYASVCEELRFSSQLFSVTFCLSLRKSVSVGSARTSVVLLLTNIKAIIVPVSRNVRVDFAFCQESSRVDREYPPIVLSNKGGLLLVISCCIPTIVKSVLRYNMSNNWYILESYDSRLLSGCQWKCNSDYMSALQQWNKYGWGAYLNSWLFVECHKRNQLCYMVKFCSPHQGISIKVRPQYILCSGSLLEDIVPESFKYCQCVLHTDFCTIYSEFDNFQLDLGSTSDFSSGCVESIHETSIHIKCSYSANIRPQSCNGTAGLTKILYLSIRVIIVSISGMLQHQLVFIQFIIMLSSDVSSVLKAIQKSGGYLWAFFQNPPPQDVLFRVGKVPYSIDKSDATLPVFTQDIEIQLKPSYILADVDRQMPIS